VLLYETVDGEFPNHHPDPTVPENLNDLIAAVAREKLDFGIAFDGDGDRVLMVGADGATIDGDDLLYLLAVDRQQRGLLRGPVVGTLMSNFGLQQALEKHGIEFVRARVGDRYVHQELRSRGGELGGETSGHLLCLDKATTGDGIVNALQVLELLQRTGSDLASLLADMHKVPQRTVNVPSGGGSRVTEDAGVQRALAEAEQELAGRGRVVLRPSGTEPVVRVTVEAPDEALLGSVQERLAAAVRNAA
jgi:phosphoglucosamine mutase